MNYKESILILEEIKKAKRILLNCHRNPDPDSIGSALAMKGVLESLGKEVDIVCPSTNLYDNVSYLKGFDGIKTGIDFRNFDFSKYDLFITLDSGSWSQVTGFKDFSVPHTKVVVIDHHLTNDKYGEINLVDDIVTSTAELLYLITEDWEVEITKEVADCLMVGIVGDTGAFRFPGVNERTFRIVSELMRKGGDKDKAVHELYRSEPFELIKFYGEVLNRVQINEQYQFVWSVIPYEIYKTLKDPIMAKESAANVFTQIVDGTEFGFIAVEQDKDKLLSVSFRSRTGFNTSKIAEELGGGGHIYASGAKIEGLPFEKAVEKVLETCRKYANKKD